MSEETRKVPVTAALTKTEAKRVAKVAKMLKYRSRSKFMRETVLAKVDQVLADDQ